MPNALASLMLVLWPLISVWFFTRLSLGRALIATLLLGYLFLPPPPAGFDFPLLPPLTKTTIPSLVALIACLVVARGDIKFWPEGWLLRTLILVFILCPFATVLTNGDPVYFGRFALPGLRLREALSMSLQQGLVLAPFLLARQILGHEHGMRDLLWALVIGGLIYSIPMLIEVRLSPQINIWVYGYFQHSFDQVIRAGGFRPIVFLYHGLWVAFFAMTALIAALSLSREMSGRRKVMMLLAALYLFAVLILCKSAASALYAILLIPLVLLLGTRMQIRVAMFICAIALTYPLLKSADLVPQDALLAQAERISHERAGSLRFRLQQESILFERAQERPLFGWGSWGRNQIFNDEGEILTTTDGQWIITLGVFGWLGFLAEFGLLSLPIFALWSQARIAPAGAVPPWAGGAALVLSINLLDLLPNATLTPLSWLLAGALIGLAREIPTEARSRSPIFRTVL